MAYEISSTEVINVNRGLVNITGGSGVYSAFHPQVYSITTVLDFDKPVMTCTLSAATTFTESNKAAGKTVTLLLDRSSTGHAPTFSGNIKWKENATPSWSNYRYWQITLIAVDSTTVRGAALGFGSTSAPPPAETVTLYGTSNSDTYFTWGQGPIFTGAQNETFNGWIFKANGAVESRTLDFSGLLVNYAQHDWCNVTPSTTYYIRFTRDGGNAVQTDPPMSVSQFGTWLALSSDQEVWYQATGEVFGSYGTRNFITKVEISTTSNGSNIIATGWYEISWEGGV